MLVALVSASHWSLADAIRMALTTLKDELSDLPCKKRRHRISDLDILLRPVAQKQVVVGEGL